MFSYSKRSGTDAIKINEKVQKSVKSKRSKMLHILSEKKTRDFHNQFINKKRPILFETIKEGYLVGHTDNYIRTIVDIPANFKNKIVNVNLMEVQGNHMIGCI